MYIQQFSCSILFCASKSFFDILLYIEGIQLQIQNMERLTQEQRQQLKQILGDELNKIVSEEYAIYHRIRKQNRERASIKAKKIVQLMQESLKRIRAEKDKLNKEDKQYDEMEQKFKKLYEMVAKLEECKDEAIYNQCNKIKQAFIEQKNSITQQNEEYALAQRRMQQAFQKFKQTRVDCLISIAADSERRAQTDLLNLRRNIQKRIKIRMLERLYEKKRQEEQLDQRIRIKYDQQQEKKGNIRIFCRIKPPIEKQRSIQVISSSTVKLIQDVQSLVSWKQKQYFFSFQKIFQENSTQEQIFKEISHPVLGVVNGKSALLFTYGQTGSGKSFTLLGSEKQKLSTIECEQRLGITQRSIKLIFQKLALKDIINQQYKVYLLMKELYLDRQNLNPTQTQILVNGAQMALEFIDIAISNRKTKGINKNKSSSRSHLIINLRVQKTNKTSKISQNSHLIIIDLAGCQRDNDTTINESEYTQEERQAQKQAISNNLALTELRSVIQGRNSLNINTQLMKFLVGYLKKDQKNKVLQKENEDKLKSKIIMIINISQDKVDSFQTKFTLQFATKAKEFKKTI